MLPVVGAHILLVKADVAADPVLAGWLYAFLGSALFCFVYIRFFYRKWGPRFEYAVARIERAGDILEVTFAPQARKMDFPPGQFVYLVVRKPDESLRHAAKRLENGNLLSDYSLTPLN